MPNVSWDVEMWKTFRRLQVYHIPTSTTTTIATLCLSPYFHRLVVLTKGPTIQSDQAKLAIQSVGQLPTQNVAAVPVDDRHQVHEAALHGNIGDIGAPDLVGSSDLKSTQEIRKDLVPWDWFAGVGLWIDGLQAHHLHQTSHSLVVDLMSLALQPGRDPWPAVERRFGVLPIDQPHELQVVVGLSCRLEVQC